MLTDRPIPGESLTLEPKNIEYERPPQTVDVKEALPMHIENLNRREGMEDIIFFMKNGVPLKTMVEGVLRSAVLEGIHSIDISLMIAPHIHEYIKGQLDALRVDYEEGFGDVDEEFNLMNRRAFDLAYKKFNEEEGDSPDVLSLEDTSIPSSPPPSDMIEEEPTPPRGLMSRG